MRHLLIDDIPNELYERLERHALKHEVSMSTLVRRAVLNELQRLEAEEQQGKLSPGYANGGSAAERIREDRTIRAEHLDRLRSPSD